eukprot:TRINITY_DN6922_c0_g1_i5.p1 TRINITY_DN6922_c0_g1~~TRINITY_DN6922_c0_g1_i5.p1  ORF type:complete len:127 (-),score=30.77 TRINITY_DN6922_c0_g1_i5:3-383(-)
MLRSLVGSEMCIRDRRKYEMQDVVAIGHIAEAFVLELGSPELRFEMLGRLILSRHRLVIPDEARWPIHPASVCPVLCVDTCLLYTSDAADEEDSVDLGGRRIIKKKKKTEKIREHIRIQKNIHNNT